MHKKLLLSAKFALKDQRDVSPRPVPHQAYDAGNALTIPVAVVASFQHLRLQSLNCVLQTRFARRSVRVS